MPGYRLTDCHLASLDLFIISIIVIIISVIITTIIVILPSSTVGHLH
jgi:hypothetical protein